MHRQLPQLPSMRLWIHSSPWGLLLLPPLCQALQSPTPEPPFLVAALLRYAVDAFRPVFRSLVQSLDAITVFIYAQPFQHNK